MMEIKMSQEAIAWYKNEMYLKDGDFIRFFARYGGSTPLQQGFSLGISADQPIHAGVKFVTDGITFYIEEDDLWFFDDHNLVVKYNPKLDEPEYHYEK